VPLYCVLETYENHRDYIEAITYKATTTSSTTTTSTTEPTPKIKGFKDYLNDILYSKLVQLEVIM